VTSCLLLPLIMNEDEDNILAANTSGKRFIWIIFFIYFGIYRRSSIIIWNDSNV
jgi:hypothetical protein